MVLFEDISVVVFKEGDRSVQVRIPVRVHFAHAQSEWTPFLNHIKNKLKLEDLEGVYDDVDGAPVVRIASLVDNGLYFARPTEVSALLRSLVRTEQERYPAWPSIEEGLEAKRELERCREYYEHQLSFLTLGVAQNKVTPAEAIPDSGEIAAFFWAMKVKQGFKCRVYKTPECRMDEVLDVLPMGTVVTLSTDWGEVMEKHPLRGKNGKGKVLWMVDPQEGFLERRPLEGIKQEAGLPGNAATVAAPAAAATMTLEERMEMIRDATKVSEILRSTLRRGAYFEGAAGVHDDTSVHRAAMRAAATLMRKDPASREALLECKGIEMFVLLISKFGDEDRILCEYGCWAFAVFAGEGDSHPRDFLFQEALVEAGGLTAIWNAVEAHRDSAPLRRSCTSALAAIVHENALTAGKVHSLSLHVTVAEEAIRRWPNNPELSCVSCWVLRSIVEPPPRSAAHHGAGRRAHSILEGGVGSASGCVVSYDSTQSINREGVGGAVTGGVMAAPPTSNEGVQQADSNRHEEGDSVADDYRGRELVPGASMADVGHESITQSKGGMSQGGSDSGGEANIEGSTTSGSVFGTGDNETSDLLISLDGGQSERLCAPAGNSAKAVISGSANVGFPTALESSPFRTMPERAINSSESIPENSRLPDIQAPQTKQQPQDEYVIRTSVDSSRTTAEVGIDGEGVTGVAEAGAGAIFEGESDGEVLERLLQLAEATKVLNYDNEDTRKAASRLVEAVLKQIDSSYACSTRRSKKASKGRLARVLREGQALGAL